MRPSTPFPHHDIPDDHKEPRITAALSAFTRDDARYRKPTDHNADGLFHGGPKGEQNPLARLQKFTHCDVTAATPENERRQVVQYRAREHERRADRPSYAVIGRFTAPKKPANSGRKKRAA